MKKLMLAMALVLLAVAALTGCATTTGYGPVAGPRGAIAPAPVYPHDPTGTADMRAGVGAARPASTGDPALDREANRSDLEWGRLAAQRERQAMEYELRRQESQRRALESVSREIARQREISARAQAQRAREESYRRRDAQRMAEMAAARAERQLRDAQRVWASRQQQGRR